MWLLSVTSKCWQDDNYVRSKRPILDPSPGYISELHGMNCTKFGENIGQLSQLNEIMLDFRYCLVLKKWLVSKIEAKFRSFSPIQNLGEGWSEYLNQLYTRDPSRYSTILIYFKTRRRSAVFKIRGLLKKDSGKIKGLSTISIDLESIH